MLFTDSDCVTLTGLANLDAEIGKVAGAQSVSIASAIRTGWEECAATIIQKMQSYSGVIAGSGYMANHLAAVYNTGSNGPVSSPMVRLSNVVVTAAQYPNSTSQILRWMQYAALYLFYRDAAVRTVDKAADRYETKAERYRVERDLAWSRLEASGLPVVISPLPCPGALHEPLTGTWDDRNVIISGTANTGAQALPYDFAVTWVGPNYLTGPIGSSESDRSTLVTDVKFAPGQTATISINSLIPATGNYQITGFADGISWGMAAVGWNLYAGISNGPLTLQNSSPMLLTTQSVYLTSVLTGAPYLGWGQNSFQNYSFIRTIQRA